MSGVMGSPGKKALAEPRSLNTAANGLHCIRIFGGLMSRCMNSFSCKHAAAEHNWKMMVLPFLNEMGLGALRMYFRKSIVYNGINN
jgi:hypothetical protein